MNSQAFDFLVYLHERGLRVRAFGDKIFVSPKEQLLPADAEFIRANKAALLEEIRLIGPVCPGKCPGRTSGLCCGAPDNEVDYLLPNGSIVNQWCQLGVDVAKATHKRCSRTPSAPITPIGSPVAPFMLRGQPWEPMDDNT